MGDAKEISMDAAKTTLNQNFLLIKRGAKHCFTSDRLLIGPLSM